MKTIWITLILATLVLTSKAQIFTCNDGEMSFFSKTPLEDIQAKSKEASAALNTGTGDVAVKIKIVTFKFPNSLMEEHFNENYLESEKFPDATFSGKLVEKVDFKKEGIVNVSAKGFLTIHGVKKQKTLIGTLDIKKGLIVLNCEFNVLLADHNIERPSVVMMKIAEKIDVKATFQLKPKP